MNRGKPWSKLKKEIKKLWVENVNADIHETVYTVGSSTNLPRIYITLDKEIIYDFWKNYQKETPRVYPCDISKISVCLRKYIDTPTSDLLNPMESDFTGITDILRSLDRRIGKEKLLTWMKDLHPEHPARQILAKRFPSKA